MGAFLDGEWESISKLFTVEESPNLYADFLEYYSPESEQDENNPANSFSKDILFQENKTNYSTTTNNNNNSDCFLPDILSCIDFSNLNEEIEASLGLSFPQNNDFHTINSNNDYSNSNDNNSMNVILPNVIKSAPKKKRDLKVFEDNQEEVNVMEKPPKKNARVSQNGLKGKTKANRKSEEDVKPNLYIKESNEIADSNSDDSNAGCVSEEMNENAESNSNTTLSLTSTGKKRASRGAATDPQSLYARKRRMRINERLRILQSLVPNGTKVDISTMLEEAFHYVKFLQLQIRLLSSDDLWMYAPLAYNGLDVGAYRRMYPFIDHL